MSCAFNVNFIVAYEAMRENMCKFAKLLYGHEDSCSVALSLSPSACYLGHGESFRSHSQVSCFSPTVMNKLKSLSVPDQQFLFEIIPHFQKPVDYGARDILGWGLWNMYAI